jgi:CTP synthase (UTP-ammonia lyase)
VTSPVPRNMQTRTVNIGLIGDRNDAVTAHRAIPVAIALAAEALGLAVEPEWLPTQSIDSSRLARFDGLWCVPASPYISMEGALRGIRFARESQTPFLGTCGGFQHAIVEYARNVLGWTDADHAETSSHGARDVVAPLLCSLVEVTDRIRFTADSLIARAYGTDSATEGYHCNYGMNPEFRDGLMGATLRISALDEQGDVRAVELVDHPFFVATLFQPERAALHGRVPPLVAAFLRACVSKDVS